MGKMSTLRDMAITHNREKLSQNENVETADERFLLIVGSENAGKTSLINQIFRTDKGVSKSSTSTYLLEYKYGRPTGMETSVGNMCHTWELGSGTTFVSLLPAIVKSQRPSLVVLVIDLTASELIVETAETLLNTLRSLLSSSSEYQYKENNMLERPFPIPLVIIGGKYDLFQNFESAKKRITCQYLQSLAQIQRAGLFFYSKNDNKLMKNVKEALLQNAFGIPVNKNNVVTDCNKPLYIPTDPNSIRNVEGSSITSEDHSLNKHKNTLLSQFNQQRLSQQNPTMPEDPARDTNFLEYVIDNLVAQKNEELKRTREESRRKAAAIESMGLTKIPTHTHTD